MALNKDETEIVIHLTQRGAHPKLVAKLIGRDERVVLGALRARDFRGPWPAIPSIEPTPALRLQARTIATTRTAANQDLAMDRALASIREPNGSLEADKLNLLIKTIIEEREKATAGSEYN